MPTARPLRHANPPHRGLDVSMHDAGGVQVLQAHQYLRHSGTGERDSGRRRGTGVSGGGSGSSNTAAAAASGGGCGVPPPLFRH